MMPRTPESDLDIPDFLKVTPAEAERRRKYNAEHPPVAVAFSPPVPKETIEARAKFAEEKKQKKTASLNALHARKVAEAEREKRGVYSRPKPGLVWSPRLGGFVKHTTMSRANYKRCLREMPDEAHRQMFLKLYGPGHGAQADVPAATAVVARKPRRPTGTTKAAPLRKAASTAPSSRPATPKSGKAAENLAAVIALLERPEGATLAEVAVIVSPNRHEHSASAFLSGIRKTRTITKAAEKRGTVYRLIEEA